MERDSPAWSAFAVAWRPDAPSPVPSPAIADGLQEAFARARQAWPQLVVPPQAYAAALGRAVCDADDCAATLATLAAEDLWLATGCALGLADAIAGFEREFGGRLDARVRRLSPASEVADLQQAIRLKLLVGDGRAPRIAEYRGYGRLDPWLRVVVARMSVDAQRRRPAPTVSSEDPLVAAVDADPELGYLKAHYAPAMREAIAAAVADLDSRDRLVLRYQVAEGLTSDRIGVIYNVHGATVRRWIAKARERLLAGTHAQIAARLSVSDDEFSSIVRLVRSQLDVSIARLLKAPESS